MDNPANMKVGPFDARYQALLKTIATLRPALHRYCARMTGSVMDGEDVVQEALFEAYRKLDQFDEARPLKPWLFRKLLLPAFLLSSLLFCISLRSLRSFAANYSVFRVSRQDALSVFHLLVAPQLQRRRMPICG